MEKLFKSSYRILLAVPENNIHNCRCSKLCVILCV